MSFLKGASGCMIEKQPADMRWKYEVGGVSRKESPFALDDHQRIEE